MALLPTPTTSDQRDGKHMRTVAIDNLRRGKNRGINLNHLAESIGFDWEDGDIYTVNDDGKLSKQL